MDHMFAIQLSRTVSIWLSFPNFLWLFYVSVFSLPTLERTLNDLRHDTNGLGQKSRRVMEFHGVFIRVPRFIRRRYMRICRTPGGLFLTFFAKRAYACFMMG